MMKAQKNIKILALIFFFLFMSACSVPGTGLPSVTLTQTPVPFTPTRTLRPTSTPRPTATPNVAHTQAYNDIFSDVQKFKDGGLIDSVDGYYIALDGFSTTLAKRGWLRRWPLRSWVEQFVYKGHIRWSTAGETDEISGCGVAFAMIDKSNGDDYYGVVLDRNRIFFSSGHGGHYRELGKTRGEGALSFKNPSEADFMMLVYDYKAYVYVNEEFIGEYALSREKELKGDFGYTMISGTNRDYGTKCEISNARIWKLK